MKQPDRPDRLLRLLTRAYPEGLLSVRLRSGRELLMTPDDLLGLSTDDPIASVLVEVRPKRGVLPGAQPLLDGLPTPRF